MVDDGQKAPCSCLVALQSTHEEKSQVQDLVDDLFPCGKSHAKTLALAVGLAQRGNTHRGNGESPAQVDVAYREVKQRAANDLPVA